MRRVERLPTRAVKLSAGEKEGTPADCHHKRALLVYLLPEPIFVLALVLLRLKPSGPLPLGLHVVRAALPHVPVVVPLERQLLFRTPSELTNIRGTFCAAPTADVKLVRRRKGDLNSRSEPRYVVYLPSPQLIALLFTQLAKASARGSQAAKWIRNID